jgi:hypothetical protein
LIAEVRIYNKTLDKTLVFNQDNSDFLIDNSGINFDSLKSSNNSHRSFEQIGETVEDIQIASGRTISFTGYVVNVPQNSLEEKKKELGRFFNPLHELTLYFGNLTIEGRPERVIEFGADYQSNNDKFCKFLIYIYCPSPVFCERDYDSYCTKKNDGYNDKTNGQNPSLMRVESKSDVQTGFIAGIKLKDGITIGGLSISHVRTHKVFQIGSSSSDGEHVAISGFVQFASEQNNWAFKWGVDELHLNFDISGITSTSTFFKLVQGTNPIAFGFYGTSGGLLTPADAVDYIRIKYKPQYLSLEGRI